LLIVCVCQQWLAFFAAQPQMTLDLPQVAGCLAVALPYIVISRLIIPHEGEAPGMEAHYAAHRGLLAGMLMAPVLASLAINFIYDLIDGAALSATLPGYAIYHGVRIGLVVPMLVWPYVLVQRCGLALFGLYTLALMFQPCAARASGASPRAGGTPRFTCPCVSRCDGPRHGTGALPGGDRAGSGAAWPGAGAGAAPACAGPVPGRLRAGARAAVPRGQAPDAARPAAGRTPGR